MRITAYEDSGKFIGHRVLPVIGLCPGYRHVNLRNELGQPLLLATLFLCIVVKDYVPDGLSDFAEALANPIKYQSELEKRAEQLAVLTEDTEPILDEDSICEAASTTSIDALSRANPNSSDGGGAPVEARSGASAENSGLAGFSGIAAMNSSGVTTNMEPVMQAAASSFSSSGKGGIGTGGNVVSTPSSVVSAVPTTSQQQPLGVSPGDTASGVVVAAVTSSSSGAAAPTKSSETIEAEEMTADPLPVILANKIVREKRQEMEKKLESLRKKHDKEKRRICSTVKSGEASDKKSKFNMGNKLVKRLSSKSM